MSKMWWKGSKIMKLKTFLICPVRGHSVEETADIVANLEKEFIVHWPPRDTDQEDPTGYRICCHNELAIKNADVVHFVWDGKSQGCLFDLGMAFAHNKKIIIVRMPDLTEGKSFQNMVQKWQSVCNNE